jgi:hypothetical protein
LAGVGNGFTKMLTVLEEAGHTPLETVHTNVLVPVIKLFTVELLSVAVVTEDPPAITVHRPVPTRGALAASVLLEEQRF